MRIGPLVALLLLATLVAFPQEPAQVPHLIRFSGQILNGAGTTAVTFTLHQSQSDNAALWTETQNVKLDSQGRYSVLLGVTRAEGLPTELFTSGQAQWLAIHAEHQAEQRVLLVSVPYAMKAGEAETLAGHSFSELVTTQKLSEEIEHAYFNTASGKIAHSPNVVLNPATSFVDTNSSQVVNVIQRGTGVALIATAASNTALTGVSNATTGSATGVLGQSSSTSGIGVRGFASATSGGTVGVFGGAASPFGTAIAANESATSGITTGILASVFSPQGTAAVFQSVGGGPLISARSGSAHSEVFSVDGSGSLKSNGANISGILQSNGANLQGNGGATGHDAALIASGLSQRPDTLSGLIGADGGDFTGGASARLLNGANGITANGGAGGDGLYSDAYQLYGGNGGAGVLGIGGPGGFGDGGTNFGTGGVGGDFIGGSFGYAGDGIHATVGYNDGYAVAGYFTGNVAITGALSTGTNGVQIDHPLDPANKYLYHASVESSEMVNLYSGNAVTDAAGHAVIQLPAWFEALNTDFRYQLTVIGQFAQAIVSRKIENQRFEIRTNLPNVEVSWLITGVRHDAVATAQPLQVEVEKPKRERGFFIRPELYGAPANRQINDARYPKRPKQASVTTHPAAATP